MLGDVVASGLVKALAHITGGGLLENVPRVLPDGIDARIELGTWPVPPLFELVRELTPRLDDQELHRTLNMGIGMVVVCAASDREAVQGAIDEPTWVIGKLVAARARRQPAVGPAQSSMKRMRRLRLPLFSTLVMRNGRDFAVFGEVGAAAGLTVDAVDVDHSQRPIRRRRRRHRQAPHETGDHCRIAGVDVDTAHLEPACGSRR